MFCRPFTGTNVPGRDDLHWTHHPGIVGTKLGHLDCRFWYDGKCCISFLNGCNRLQTRNIISPPSVSAKISTFEVGVMTN